MTSNWTIRILAGLVVVVLVVLGVTLISGGDGEGDDSSSPALADKGSDNATDGKGRGGKSQGEADAGDAGSAEARKEIQRARRERAAANEMTEDEKEAQTRAQRFYDILGAEKGDKNSTDFDSAGFCDLMSEEARAQTIEYAKRSSGIDQEWNCENSVELLVIRSKRTGGFAQTRKARIVGVNAEGDRATATVRFGRGPLTSIPLVKEDGEWKLGPTASGSSGDE